MGEKDVNQLSAIRRAAALARWKGREKATFRTIRVRDDVLGELSRMPGDTWSDRVERLLKAVKA